MGLLLAACYWLMLQCAPEYKKLSSAAPRPAININSQSQCRGIKKVAYSWFGHYNVYVFMQYVISKRRNTPAAAAHTKKQWLRRKAAKTLYLENDWKILCVIVFQSESRTPRETHGDLLRWPLFNYTSFFSLALLSLPQCFSIDSQLLRLHRCDKVRSKSYLPPRGVLEIRNILQNNGSIGAIVIPTREWIHCI